jgi:hypothetical protein
VSDLEESAAIDLVESCYVSWLEMPLPPTATYLNSVVDIVQGKQAMPYMGLSGMAVE